MTLDAVIKNILLNAEQGGSFEIISIEMRMISITCRQKSAHSSVLFSKKQAEMFFASVNS